jgi:hypothetical protein
MGDLVFLSELRRNRQSHITADDMAIMYWAMDQLRSRGSDFEAELCETDDGMSYLAFGSEVGFTSRTITRALDGDGWVLLDEMGQPTHRADTIKALMMLYLFGKDHAKGGTNG